MRKLTHRLINAQDVDAMSQDELARAFREHAITTLDEATGGLSPAS